MVELQKRHAGQHQLNMFIPDLHSITTPIDYKLLYKQTLDNLKVYVAAGLDINDENTFIYRQSYIPAHSELTWILDCFTGFGELSRMTQFKDKSRIEPTPTSEAIVINESIPEARKEMGKEYWKNDPTGIINKITESKMVTAGLFNYPVLMAADILLYGATYVPLGDDQRQHLEITRDLAIRINNKFGDIFTVPEEWSKQLEFAKRDNGIRIRSLRNPEKKMSKSVADPTGTILLSDSPADAAKKVMRAETDSFGEIKFDLKERPGISNLLQMLALLTGQPQAEVNARWEGKNSYGDLKKAVAQAVESFLTNLQSRLNQVDEVTLLTKLEQDEQKMNQIANQTLLKVQKAVGLRP